MPQPPCHAADFFVLRSPSLPLGSLLDRGRAAHAALAGASLEQDREALRRILRDLAGRDAVREALALASPDLAGRLGAWLEGALDPAAARHVERGLLKYFSRMSSRSTPFGLFAGVSIGTWGTVSRLSLEPWQGCRKAVRLDWSVLESLVDRLEREPQLRSGLAYRPNSSLHACGGWYRYLERRDEADQGRTYHLEAVEATPHLDFVLRQARAGARLGELAAGLAERMKVEAGEAFAYLERVIEAQVLCGDLHPPLTSPDPVGHVASCLRAHPAAAPRAEAVAALGAELKILQASSPGSHPEGYQDGLPSLADLGIPTGVRDLLQVDLHRPAKDLALSPAVRQALEEGADTLRRMTPAPGPGPLDRFRSAFLERYGTRWMPLLQVLDEENGIGFDGVPPLEGPLLEGLSFPVPAPSRGLTDRDGYLLAQMPRWQGGRVWELEDADLEALANPDPPPFPGSFAALASLAAASVAALDRGEFHFWMEQFSGPTAARWLGRFASGNADLAEALRDHLRKEEAARPEAVFAEVVHVPEGRMGNVLARPSMRDHEIPFLATPGVPDDRSIPPSDLQVTVRGGRIVLASGSLGREVVPRLSSAHNYAHGPAVYRFLARLQDQDGRPGGWSWGALADQPFLPRVVRGRHVLCKARWRIEARELEGALAATTEGPWGAFQALRERRGLPRFVTLADADNNLLVDLDQVLWVETLHHLVARRAAFTLAECFPDPAQAVVSSPEGRFAHELVIPFEAPPPPSPGPATFPPKAGAQGPRSFAPGSEWLYLKLYCGPATADRILVGLEPLLRLSRAHGLWDRWHFVRYRDPEPHLRLRFHGLPFRLLAELLPLLHRHLEGPLSEGLLWRWQVDTFEPEWERYGGVVGFELAEAWFHDDSQRVLSHLGAGLPAEKRWRMGLRGVDAIWAALGLSVRARRDLARAARDGFRREFGEEGAGSARMGAKFRGLRADLERGFPQPEGVAFGQGLHGLSRIREAFETGLMQEEVGPVAASLAHMHLNRLLRTNHREQEWVLMEFLVRLYESSLARTPRL